MDGFAEGTSKGQRKMGQEESKLNKVHKLPRFVQFIPSLSMSQTLKFNSFNCPQPTFIISSSCGNINGNSPQTAVLRTSDAVEMYVAATTVFTHLYNVHV